MSFFDHIQGLLQDAGLPVSSFDAAMTAWVQAPTHEGARALLAWSGAWLRAHEVDGDEYLVAKARDMQAIIVVERQYIGK